MKAYLHQIRIAPKKVNLVADLIRGRSIQEASNLLRFAPKRAAPILLKLLKSAAANAENNFKQDPDKLIISKVIVNEGTTLKRGLPVSRGRWHPILKRTSHVLIELSLLSEGIKNKGLRTKDKGQRAQDIVGKKIEVKALVAPKDSEKTTEKKKVAKPAVATTKAKKS